MSNFHWLGSVKHSSVLIVKVLIGTFNHKNTLTGAFSMIVKFLLRFVSSSSMALVVTRMHHPTAPATERYLSPVPNICSVRTRILRTFCCIAAK